MKEIESEPKYFWANPKSEILLFKREGIYYAYRSICPHMGGQLRYEEKANALQCPWHPLSFHAETGKSSHCRFKNVQRYETEIRNGELLVYGGGS